MNLKDVLQSGKTENYFSAFLVALVIIICLYAVATFYTPGSVIYFSDHINDSVIDTYSRYNKTFNASYVLVTKEANATLQVQWVDSDHKPLHTIYIIPKLAKGELQIELYSEGNAKTFNENMSSIRQDAHVLKKNGLWGIYQPTFNGKPGFNKSLGREMLFAFSFLWVIIFISGLLIIFTHRWKKDDLPLLLPLVLYVILAIVIKSFPLDIKLHFLVNEFDSINLVEIYGLGSASLKVFIAHFLGYDPDVLFAILKIFGLLSLVLLYLVVLHIAGKRLYAIISVSMLVASPLVLRVFFSDSCHVASFFALLVSLAMIADKSGRFVKLKAIMAMIALVVAASVRFEFFPVLFLPLMIVGFSNKSRVLVSRTSWFVKSAALLPAIFLLVFNYAFVLKNMGGQEKDFLDVVKTFWATTGISSDNLFFNHSYNTLEYMLLTKAGFLIVFFTRRTSFSLAVFVFTSLFFLHSFTIAPIYQSLHYQFFGWLPEYLLAAYAIFYVLQIFYDKLNRLSYLWLFSIIVFGFALFNGYQKLWLLDKEPAAFHAEYELLEKNRDSFESVENFYSWKIGFDCCLSNPENMIKAYGYNRVNEHKIDPGNITDFRNAKEGGLYYRGVVCYADEEIFRIFKKFEAGWEMEPIALHKVKGVPFGDKSYLSDNVEIGLFRLKNVKSLP